MQRKVLRENTSLNFFGSPSFRLIVYGHLPKLMLVLSQRVGTFGRFRQHFKSSSFIYFGVGTFSKCPFRTALAEPAYEFLKETMLLDLYLNMLALFLELPTANQELSLTYISTCRHFLPLGVSTLTYVSMCTGEGVLWHQ